MQRIDTHRIGIDPPPCYGVERLARNGHDRLQRIGATHIDAVCRLDGQERLPLKLTHTDSLNVRDRLRQTRQHSLHIRQ